MNRGWRLGGRRFDRQLQSSQGISKGGGRSLQAALDVSIRRSRGKPCEDPLIAKKVLNWGETENANRAAYARALIFIPRKHLLRRVGPNRTNTEGGEETPGRGYLTTSTGKYLTERRSSSHAGKKKTQRKRENFRTYDPQLRRTTCRKRRARPRQNRDVGGENKRAGR